MWRYTKYEKPPEDPGRREARVKQFIPRGISRAFLLHAVNYVIKFHYNPPGYEPVIRIPLLLYYPRLHFLAACTLRSLHSDEPTYCLEKHKLTPFCTSLVHYISSRSPQTRATSHYLCLCLFNWRRNFSYGTQDVA